MAENVRPTEDPFPTPEQIKQWPTPKGQPAQGTKFHAACFKLRDACHWIKDDILSVRNDADRNGFFDMSDCKDQSEVMANLTLAYRHLEDARMRIGKAIQAYDGRDILGR